MAFSAPAASSQSGPSPSSPAKVDPILRNAIRYTISAEEYRTLHEFLIKRTPKTLSKAAPPPAKYEAAVQSKDDFNAAAIRASLRLFVATQTGLKAWDLFVSKVLRRGQITAKPPPRSSVLTSPNIRLSFSVSLLLLLHRLLYRFFTRLRANLLTKDAAPFRKRNPRVSRALTARLAPAIGASLAGFALGIYPADQFRITVAIYAATRAAEFAYNALDDDGWFENKPWWFGSWLLMPPVFGQLLHALLFDKDCFPKPYGDFIMKYSPTYIHQRPADYPSHLPWPDQDTVVSGLAEISRLKYPPYVSPVLFPDTPSPLPPSLAPLAPLTSRAHPAITSLTCAVLHPSDPSCTRTNLTFYLYTFPAFARLFTVILGIFALPRYKAFLANPSQELNRLGRNVLRISLFAGGAIGTAWGSICLGQALLPRTFLPQQRWFWGGFVAGLWAFMVRHGMRAQFLYSFRASADSAWKVGLKHGWVRGWKGGDLAIIVTGLAVANVVFDVNEAALRSGIMVRGLKLLRGEEKDKGKGKEKGTG